MKAPAAKLSSKKKVSFGVATSSRGASEHIVSIPVEGRGLKIPPEGKAHHGHQRNRDRPLNMNTVMESE